jgi:hypothetical protein
VSLPPEEFTFDVQDRVIALLKGAQHAVECGLERMVLVKTSKRGPRNYDRWRVAPGLYGRVVGSIDRGRWLVDVSVVDVVRWLEKTMRVTP